MIKRDPLFYTACAISVIGLVLSFMVHELFAFLLVAAYLLRPGLHVFGFAVKYADERQQEIHARSGNAAFIVVMIAVAGFAMMRIVRGEAVDEFYELIVIGLAARALIGLIMVGDFRKAGVMIINTVGVLLGAYIVLSVNLSEGSLFGMVVASIIVSIGLLGNKFPRLIAVMLAVGAVSIIIGFRLYEFRLVSSAMWLFFVMPMVTATACLFLGSYPDEKPVSIKLRRVIFGSLSAGAVLVFALISIIGGQDKAVLASGERHTIPENEIEYVQEIACTGSIQYYKTGKLLSATLAREDTLSGQPLPPGTVVNFTAEGDFDWCFLPKNIVIQGHNCRGENHGFMTCFYPNGQLKTAWLAEDEIIEGVPCAKFRFLSSVFGGGDATRFHDNGKLRFCTLSEDFTIDGRLFKKGNELQWNRDGNLRVFNKK